MTIHQAKGLEFDIVIVPQAARGARSSDRDLLVWTEDTNEEGTLYLKIAAQPQKGESTQKYDEIEAVNKTKDEEENKRLFYVACTRAKNALYVIGSADRKKDGAVKKAGSNTFIGMVWNSVEGLFQGELRRLGPQQKNFMQAFNEADKKTILKRLPTGWRVPEFAMSVAWQPELERAPASARKISYEWVSDTSRLMGTVVHELLKRIAAEGAEQWNASRVNGLQPLIRAELLRMGVPAIEEPGASGQVLRAVANTLRSDRGRWLLQPHAEASSEYASQRTRAG